MKKQLKKPFLMMAVTALVLVGTLKVGGAMAYFTTYSTASGSVQMNMGFTQTNMFQLRIQAIMIVLFV